METINDRMEQLVNELFNGNKSAFAKAIGLPATGLSNYIGNARRSKPSVDMVAKIAANLHVDAYWLLTGEHQPPATEEEANATGNYSAASVHGNATAGSPTAETEVLRARLEAASKLLDEKQKLLDEKERTIRLYEKLLTSESGQKC